MARLNRRKLQDARNVEKIVLKDSGACYIPLVKLNLESTSPNEASKTRNRVNTPQEKSLDSSNKPVVVLENCDFESLQKGVSTRGRTVGNDPKTTGQKTVSKALTSSKGEQSKKYTRLKTTKESGHDLINAGITKTESTELNNKNSKSKHYNSVKTTENKGTDLNSNVYKDLPNTKILRKRKLLDYKERSSIGTPEQSVNAKIPIYRRNIVKPEKSSKRDPFAFIPEPDEGENSDSSFRINTPKKRKIAHVKPTKIVENTAKKLKTANVIKYNDKINGTLNLIRTKLNKKNYLNSSNVNKQSNDKKSHRTGTGVSIFNSTQINNVQNLSTLGESHGDISVVKMLNTENTLKNKSSVIFTPERSEIVDVDTSKSLSRISFRSNSPKKNSTRINIIQNCVLDNSNVSGGTWRFETDIMTRNPHLISLKSNALPTLSQEPILDYTFDDKIEKMNRSVQIPTTKISPKQQSILNYIPTSNEYTKENNHRQSLYDIDELSPLKFSNKENSSGKKQPPIHKAKRNILGQLDSNALTSRNQTSTPNKLPLDAPQFDVSIGKSSTLNFSSNSIEQNTETLKNSEAKPFRLEVNYKQYKPKRRPQMITKPLRDSEVDRLIEKDVGFDDMIDNHDLERREFGLFEDMEAPVADTKIYKPRTKKHIPGDHSPKKKDPAKFSKEALKWIKEFNQMCNEVDQTELEIA